MIGWEDFKEAVGILKDLMDADDVAPATGERAFAWAEARGIDPDSLAQFGIASAETTMQRIAHGKPLEHALVGNAIRAVALGMELERIRRDREGMPQ